MGRPATGQTPPRSVRVPDEIWDTALGHAKTEGRTLSDVIVEALQRYIAAAERRARKATDQRE